MENSLRSWINLYSFSTGRRLFAFQQVKVLAEEVGFAALAAHLVTAIAHDRTTHVLDRQWDARKAAPTDGGAVRTIDIDLDRALTGIRDTGVAQQNGLPAGHPTAIAIGEMLIDLFPAGVQVITTAAFIDELAEADRIVEALQGQYAALVAQIGLGLLTARLAELAVTYRQALEKAPPTGLDYGTVRAQREQGQEHLLQAAVMILGKYWGSTAEVVSLRGKLLAPIVRQNDAIGAYLRSRRAVQDVNPETGEVEPNAPESGGEGGPTG